MEHLGGTRRPSVSTVMDMVWSDMQRALDVRPKSCTVRTYQDLISEEVRETVNWQFAETSRQEAGAKQEPDSRRGGRSPQPTGNRQGPMALVSL